MLVVDYEARAHDVSWRCQADTIKTTLSARVLAPYKRIAFGSPTDDADV